MDWIKVAGPEILQLNDFVGPAEAGNRKICLVKSGQDIFITQRKCPHAGADLSHGWCREGRIVCPYHRYSYSLETGRGAAGQGDYIDIYPVEVRSDGVYVGLKRSGGWLKNLFR